MTEPLSRPAASDAVAGLGWRLILGRYLAAVPVASLTEAAEVASLAVAAAGADRHLQLDLRRDRVELALGVPGALSRDDVDTASTVRDALVRAGHRLGPAVGSATRSVQLLEIAIDALDIAAIRPFWRAVLGYGDEPGNDEDDAAVTDPLGQGPTVWFQQMDEPRPQRNRIHVDIAVPHDEAQRRIEAALAAGGVLVSDAEARSFWILADVEGNEICVCTWQDRD